MSANSNMENTNETCGTLTRYLSPLGVWALSFGCAVGWGAFVMPGTTFLPMAGPLGTALGILAGAVVMFLIGVNYHFLMNKFPNAGGTLTYSIRAFGYDHGLLSAWFLILVYIAISWANATAIVLIARNLLGDLLQFGFHYRVAGYDVFLGEVLLTLTVIVFFGWVCMHSKRVAIRIQIIMAVMLLGGIVLCAVMAFSRSGFHPAVLRPAFAPTGKGRLTQVINVVVLAPWAFVGFESVSNSTQGFTFSAKRSLGIMGAALVTGALSYILLALLAISALPEGYADWASYIADVGSLNGLAGLPTFHAANAAMGSAGVYILGLAVLGGIVTGLIGNLIAGSRLLYAMGQEDILPPWFCRLDKEGNPRNAVLFLVGISLFVPFVGRAAIGWIVDVNTIGATIAYGYTSAAAFKLAREEGNRLVRFTGAVGALASVLFFLYFMVPSFWTVSAMSTESYLILIAWSVLGFLFFRYVFYRDNDRKFGKSTAVWMALLFLTFFTSVLWLRQTTHDATREMLGELSAYHADELRRHGVELTEEEQYSADLFLERKMEQVSDSLTGSSMAQMGLIVVALLIMFSIYRSMMERERSMEVQKLQAEQNTLAKSTFLANMSHDLRTPMNAVIGYTGLAKKEENIPPKVGEYLDKIEASSQHLLSLINDVLEISRIENGKLELEIEQNDLVRIMDEVRDLFSTQMETKGLRYTVTADGVSDRVVMCDAKRLNRVLLNLISNAFKFTPPGGSVSVSLRQRGAEEGVGSYELRVRDTGMGMSPEFAATVFDAYSRERSAANIQGTGLGMAITKSIVDMMNGVIEVKTEKSKGTEFIVRVDFPLCEAAAESGEEEAEEDAAPALDFSKIRLLLVEDNEINREIATLILSEAGFRLDTAENGQIAVNKITVSRPGTYHAILMDVQMPVMNGYDATRAIRALPDKRLANIPIIAMTANAFAEDVQTAMEAGMNGHISKPIDVNRMMETLTEVLKRSAPSQLTEG